MPNNFVRMGVVDKQKCRATIIACNKLPQESNVCNYL